MSASEKKNTVYTSFHKSSESASVLYALKHAKTIRKCEVYKGLSSHSVV